MPDDDDREKWGRAYDRVDELDGRGQSPDPDDESEEEPTAEWPKLDSRALYGLAGEFVNFVAPATETDPLALLSQFMAAFGNAAGKVTCYAPDGIAHYLNLFLLLCGASAKSRKGSSWYFVRQPCELADFEWARERIQSGRAI
jgi:hypothetical protein